MRFCPAPAGAVKRGNEYVPVACATG